MINRKPKNRFSIFPGVCGSLWIFVAIWRGCGAGVRKNHWLGTSPLICYSKDSQPYFRKYRSFLKTTHRSKNSQKTLNVGNFNLKLSWKGASFFKQYVYALYLDDLGLDICMLTESFPIKEKSWSNHLGIVAEVPAHATEVTTDAPYP